MRELGLGHADHVGGLEWLGLKNYFIEQGRRIRMFVPEPLRRPLWENCLKGGMELLDFGLADLDQVFAVEEVATDESFTWMGAPPRGSVSQPALRMAERLPSP